METSKWKYDLQRPLHQLQFASDCWTNMAPPLRSFRPKAPFQNVLGPSKHHWGEEVSVRLLELNVHISDICSDTGQGMPQDARGQGPICSRRRQENWKLQWSSGTWDTEAASCFDAIIGHQKVSCRQQQPVVFVGAMGTIVTVVKFWGLTCGAKVALHRFAKEASATCKFRWRPGSYPAAITQGCGMQFQCNSHKSSVQTPGCLMIIGDNTTQYIGDYVNPRTGTPYPPTRIQWNERGILNTDHKNYNACLVHPGSLFTLPPLAPDWTT